MRVKTLFRSQSGFLSHPCHSGDIQGFSFFERIHIVVLKRTRVLVIQRHHDLFNRQILRLNTLR